MTNYLASRDTATCYAPTRSTWDWGKGVSGHDYRLGSVGLLRMRGPVNASFSAIALGGVVQFWKAQNSVLNAVGRKCETIQQRTTFQQSCTWQSPSKAGCRGWKHQWMLRIRAHLTLQWTRMRRSRSIACCLRNASSVILHLCKYASDGLVAWERHSH